MHELLGFFSRNSKWFVFMLLVILGCVLLFRSNPYQHHVYLTSANTLSSAVYRLSDNVYSYFNLRQINQDLNQRNADLQTEVMYLRQLLLKAGEDSVYTVSNDSTGQQYQFVVAHVINNSISKPFNYITINKGAADGIRPEMGIIDQNGVVGSVNVVGEHSSRVISVLNPNFHVSCKIRGTDHFGSLSWDGIDPRYAMLEDMPRHSQVKPGDTIVTTGFSKVYPPDIMVGVVLPPKKGEEFSLNNIRIKLSTDFSTLSNVQVVINNLSDELSALEATDSNVSQQH